MAVVRNLMVRGGADFSGMRNEMRRTQQNLQRFQGDVNRSMSGVEKAVSGTSKALGGIKTALVALGIGSVIKDAVSNAMEMESSIAQINRIMGTSAEAFKVWADANATAFGMAKSEAMKYGAVYGNLISGFAKDTGQTMQYTEQLLKASAVVASATGRSMEDTMDRIRSGLLGNTESIEDLGINVNVAMIESTNAFKQFANGKSWQKLDFQTQQQIRLMAILEQANKKYGDSLADTTATNMMMFTAQLKNIQTSLGQAFLPIVNVVLPVLTTLASQLSYVMGVVAQFMAALFGVKQSQQATAATTAQASAVGDLGDAYKDAGKAAKGALAGFDEVNTLSSGSSGGGGSAGGTNGGGVAGVSPNTPTPEMNPKILETANAFKSALQGIGTAAQQVGSYLLNTFGPPLQTAIGMITPVLLQFKTDISNLFANLGDLAAPLKGYFTSSLIPFLQQTIINMGVVLSGLLDSARKVFVGVGDVAMVALRWLANDGLKMLTDFFSGAQTVYVNLFKSAKSTFDRILTNVIIPNMLSITMLITQTLTNLKTPLYQLGSDIATTLTKTFNGLMETLTMVFTDIITALKPVIDWLIVTGLPLIVDFADKVVQCFDKLFTDAKAIFDKLWTEGINPGLQLISTMIVDVLDIIAGFWYDWGVGIMTDLGDTFDAVKSLFDSLWDNMIGPAWTFLCNQLSWLWSSHIKGLVTEITNFIGKLVQAVLEITNKFIVPIINLLVKNLGPTFVSAFKGIVSTVGTLLATVADVAKGVIKILGGIVDFITGVLTGNWTKAFQGLKDIVVGIFESIGGVIKGVINTIIDGVNCMIRGLNHIKVPEIDLPGVGKVGGWGVNINEIPKLARGAVISSPTIAMVGEAGREAVMPLENNTGWIDELAGKIVNGMSMVAAAGQGGSRSGDVVLQVDGTTFARLIAPYAKAESSRVGKVLIQGV